MDEDAVGDHLPNSDAPTAVADEAVIAAVAERRRRALDAMVVTVDAPLAVDALPVKAQKAPAGVCRSAGRDLDASPRCVHDEPISHTMQKDEERDR